MCRIQPKGRELDPSILMAERVKIVSGVVAAVGIVIGAIALSCCHHPLLHTYGTIGLAGMAAFCLGVGGIAQGVKRHLENAVTKT